ncbi:MAG: hypothetical protein M1832_003562 [Thelocarpon impressellum]|nr:MAG: hypothetical protein M1832_003562 [Thelocarpon impressellum]
MRGLSFELAALLSGLSLLQSVAVADRCDVKPISLPWANITLPDGITIQRGIYVALGKSQGLGLRATTILNNTRLRNIRDCQGSANASQQSGCAGASGSNYDLTKTSSWVNVSPSEWNVTTIDAHSIDETVLDGYEDVRVGVAGGPPLLIPQMPLEVWSNAKSDNKSGLALGPASSFLKKLLDIGVVPSTVFGLFSGSRSQLRAVDGNLTIGGWDAARVAGPWTNFSTDVQDFGAPCPLQVRVRDIRLGNVNGSFSLLPNRDSTITACIEPLVNNFYFNQAIIDRWANLTQHRKNASGPDEPPYAQQIYPPSNAPLIGNLTIELDNGYTTVIPNHELVSQERGTNAEGKYDVVNASRLMAAVATGSNPEAGGGPTFGGVYLSQNYLLVDHSKKMFSMAPAVTGPVGDGAHDIRTVCQPEAKSKDPAPVSTQTRKRRLSTGVIVAIVAGALGGLIAISVASLFALRAAGTRGSQYVNFPKPGNGAHEASGREVPVEAGSGRPDSARRESELPATSTLVPELQGDNAQKPGTPSELDDGEK